MNDRTKDPFEYAEVDDENFDAPPDEPRWGGNGPTDKNAPVITDAD